jgi:mRNA interferase RelE/StbE
MDKIRDKDLDRIATAIRSLKENPRPPGCKKIRNVIYRIRVGYWRVIYAVYDKDKLVVVGKVERRSEDTYGGVDELF